MTEQMTEQMTDQMTELHAMELEKPPPKKRGRKPLTEEQKAERTAIKKQKAESQRVPPSLKVSFVCNDDDNQSSDAPQASVMEVMQPSEVISLLNSTQTCSTGSSIPSRLGSWSSQRQVVTGAIPFRDQPSQIMEESDDDEDAATMARPKPKILDMSEKAIVTLMGAHTDLRQWPSSTDICCWNCCHTFKGVPVPATSTLDSRKTGKLTKCHGVFCSFNCAKRFILDKNTHGAWEASTLLSMLHKRITGHHAPIRTAPPRICLTMFGGNMTIAEYRHGFISLPVTDSMYDEQARAKSVQLLQDNCMPTFSRALIQKTNGSSRAIAKSTEIPRHERNSVLRRSTLHKSMNMHVS